MHIIAGRACRWALILAAAVPTLAAAQAPDLRTQTTRGIGYSGSIPDAMVGAGVWQFFGSSRIGAFVEAKTTLPSLESDGNFCPEALASCTVPWVEANRNDFRIASENEYLIVNAGGMYALGSQFAVMLGAGMAKRKVVHEYIHDEDEPDLRITWEGNYYVPDDAEWQLQATAGVLMRISRRFAFTFGFETAPNGMAVGAYVILP